MQVTKILFTLRRLNDDLEAKLTISTRNIIPERPRTDPGKRKHPVGVNGSTSVGPSLNPRNPSSAFSRLRHPICSVHIKSRILHPGIREPESTKRDSVSSCIVSRTSASTIFFPKITNSRNPAYSSSKHDLPWNLYPRRTKSRRNQAMDRNHELPGTQIS